ncbi:kelch domain-containing protein 1 [Haplosporangium gracile]|nr:kelch domain-containing protein 1 [Haplosporangium gracile]
MSLDLNVSWTTVNPAWTKLADGPSQDLFPAAFTSDEQTMFVFHLKNMGAPMQYSVETNTWTITNLTFDYMNQQGINVVTDPRTGLMYLPGGYSSRDNTARTFTQMETIDPITLSVRLTSLPTSIEAFPVRWYYGNVWSEKRKAILYFGGNDINPSSPQNVENIVTQFWPDTMNYNSLAVVGDTPPMRVDHCMAANEKGTKVLIYGGRLRTNQVDNEVYVLDVEIQTWTKGVPSNQTRMYTACTIAGDQLLIWGGRSAENVMAPAGVLIYDYVKRNWTTQYTPPASYASLKAPSPIVRTVPPWVTGVPTTPITTPITNPNPTPIPTPNLNSNSIVVAAGVTGGLALAAAVIGIFFFQHRRKQRKDRGFFAKTTSNDPEESKSLATSAASFGSNRNGSRRSDLLAKDPMESNEEYELEQTLMDLEEQKRELELKQQLLVLQHRADNPENTSGDAAAKAYKRGPTAYVEPETEYIPVLARDYSEQQQQEQRLFSPGASSTAKTTFSDKSSAFKPATVSAVVQVVSPTYAVTSPFSPHSASSSSYISPSSIVRTTSTGGAQGGLVQLEPEPVYESSPGFNPEVPDLVYEQMTGSGKQWVRRAQGPQIVVNPGAVTVRSPHSSTTIALPSSSP